MIGETLGHYRVLEKLGQGGMGEVFLAEDTKLGREVALKVLPEEVAGDPDRLERFRREAKLLATLNHPNIGAIYGLEEAGERPFLVLELVSGEDLSDSIAKGPMPVEEAVAIALQLADALRAAHERGVVHRDLKPANVKRTSDGRIKVLDFGLAKAVVAEAPSAELSSSPTAAMSQTAPGMILGTARYMSPEQARGRPIDARTDIWAFGAVLFEMLTGRPLIEGDTLSDILASVLKDDPDWSRLPADVSPRVRELLALCLERDPEARLAHIGDARIWLRRSSEIESPPARARRAAPLVAAAVLAVVGIAALLSSALAPKNPPGSSVERYALRPSGMGEDLYLTNPVLSDDGARLLVVANADGVEQGVYQRRIDELELAPVAGTENAGWATFSPDGSQLLFFDARQRTLNRVSVHGGPRKVLADPGYVPAHWAPDGYIYFTESGTGGLLRVHEDGGEPERLTSAEGETEGHQAPTLLPDGRTVLFAVGSGFENSGWDVALLDTRTGSWRRLLEHGVDPSYASGYVFFSRDQRYWAAPFDVETLELQVEPQPVLTGAQLHPGAPLEFVQTFVSSRGSLIYLRGDATPQSLRTVLVSVAVDGTRDVLLEDTGATIYTPAVSPDGRRIAFTRAVDGQDWAVWSHDSTSGASTRLSIQGGQSFTPVWSRDGKSVAFSVGDLRAAALYRKELGGGTERFTEEDVFHRALSWHPDGSLLFSRDTNQGDILVVSPDGTVTPVVATDAAEGFADLSPDGRWIAFDANLIGTREIYLSPFPPTSADPVQVSIEGGLAPRWSADGRTLYYREGFPAGRIVAVEIATEPELVIGSRATFTSLQGVRGGRALAFALFDVTSDGRVVFPERTVSFQSGDLVLVKNWAQELDTLFER